MKNIKRYLIPLAAITAVLTLITAGIVAGSAEGISPASAATPSINGIGALGRIEPQSRVIRVSHDQGMEGAYIHKIFVEEGQNVKAGDVLLEFSDLERRKAEVNIARAKLESSMAKKNAYAAQKDIAEITFIRAGKLIKENAISKADYDEAKADLNKASAELETATHDIAVAEAELELSTQRLEQSTVKSPINATILKIYKWAGERADDTHIMDIADLSKLDIVAEIYESDFPRIEIGQIATIRIPGDNSEYHATVRETGFMVQKNDLNDTDPLADRDNRVVEVRLSLEHDSVAKLNNQIFRQVQVQITP